jgi:hypothetical protein
MTTNLERYEKIKDAPLAKGKKEYLKYLKGGRLSAKQAILANCYVCMGYFSDGKDDCKIKSCSLYDFMPYKEGGVRKSRIFSEEQKEASKVRFEKIRKKKEEERESLRRRR